MVAQHLGHPLGQPRRHEVHIALRALVEHHEVTCRHMVADKDMPLCRDQLLVVPPHIDAQKEQQDCIQT